MKPPGSILCLHGTSPTLPSAQALMEAWLLTARKNRIRQKYYCFLSMEVYRISRIEKSLSNYPGDGTPLDLFGL